MSAVEMHPRGEFHAPLEPMFICPGGPVEPDECDCGHVGGWEWRALVEWHEQPGFRRTDSACRRDVNLGLPPRPHDEGWWVMTGREERCPQCGDIERLDADGEVIAVQVSRIGRYRWAQRLRAEADALRDQADEIEQSAWLPPDLPPPFPGKDATNE